MTRRAADTSVEAFRGLSVAAVTEGQRRVLEALQPGRLYSRRDLEALTKMRTGSVCGRVKELLDADLIEVHGTKTDPESGKTVETLRCVQAQRDLFGKAAAVAA